MAGSPYISSQNMSLVFFMFIWYACSTMVNVAWKNTYKQHPHGIALTLIQFSVAEIISLVVSFMITDQPLKPLFSPSGAHATKQYLVVGIAFAIGQLCTNASLSIVSVSVTHVIKLTEPVIAVVLGKIVLKEEINKEKLLYIVCILTGAGISCVTDSSFHYKGLVFAGLSNVFLQIRNLFVKLVKGDDATGNSPNGLTLYLISNTVGVVFLIPVTLVYIMYNGYSWRILYKLNLDCIMLGVYFAGQHIASYLVLQEVFITTHAVLNVMKRVVVIVLCSLIFQNYIGSVQIFGVCLAVTGFYLYSVSVRNKSYQKQQPNQTTITFFNGCCKKAFFTISFLLCLGFFTASSTIYSVGAQSEKGSQPTIIPSQKISQIVLPFISSQKSPQQATPVNSSQKSPQPATLVISSQKKQQPAKQFISSQKGSQSPTPVIALWAYFHDLDPKSLRLLKDLGSDNNERQITVLCSTLRCLRSIKDMNIANVKGKQLKVLEIVNDTIVAKWVRRHALMKVFYGPTYEVNLQRAVQLALLWKQENIVISLDTMVVQIDQFVQTLNNLKTDSCILSNDQSSLSVCYLRKGHYFIQQLMLTFVSQMSKPVEKLHGLAFEIVFKQALHSMKGNGTEGWLPANVTDMFAQLIKPTVHPFNKNKFGLLDYDTNNLGDEVQSIASAHFLPYVDYFLLRDWKAISIKENLTMLMNAFWPAKRIPSKADNIHPILVGVHIYRESSKTDKILKASRDFYNKYGVVGTRDTATMELFLELGIQAKMTGCLTPFIQNPFHGMPREDIIYTVDTRSGTSLLPPYIYQKSKHLSHAASAKERKIRLARFSRAYSLLERYARAKVVITTRVHVALPCVGLGTPVIFLNLKGLFGATSTRETPRVSGHTALFHTVDMYKLSTDEAMEYLRNFNWTHPPPNPNPQLADAYRQEAWSIMGKNKDIFDAHDMYSLRP